MQTYGMDNSTLWSNNPQIDPECSNIYIGEVLCVDTTQFAYPDFNSSLYDVGQSSFSLLNWPPRRLCPLSSTRHRNMLIIS